MGPPITGGLLNRVERRGERFPGPSGNADVSAICIDHADSIALSPVFDLVNLMQDTKICQNSLKLAAAHSLSMFKTDPAPKLHPNSLSAPTAAFVPDFLPSKFH